MTAADCEKVAPEGLTEAQAHDKCAWRNYELGWRVLAAELTLSLLKPDSSVLKAKVDALRAAPKVDEYVQFHHHGPFFPGVDASLLDLSPNPETAAPLVRAQMLESRRQHKHAALDFGRDWRSRSRPKSGRSLYRIMIYEDNAEQYFTTHAGDARRHLLAESLHLVPLPHARLRANVPVPAQHLRRAAALR